MIDDRGVAPSDDFHIPGRKPGQEENAKLLALYLNKEKKRKDDASRGSSTLGVPLY